MLNVKPALAMPCVYHSVAYGFLIGQSGDTVGDISILLVSRAFVGGIRHQAAQHK